MDLQLRTLDGYIALFAKLNLGFYKKTFQKKLISFRGPRFDIPLFDFPYKKKFELGTAKIPVYDFIPDPAILGAPEI